MSPRRVHADAWGALILVVDDEEDVRGLVQEILQSAGYRTLGASGGGQAVQVLKERSDVDLVLTDLIMPDYDGPTLARRVEQDRPGLPVLFMTGYPLETLKALGMLPPGDPPIGKPFPIRELVLRVRQALSEKS